MASHTTLASLLSAFTQLSAWSIGVGALIAVVALRPLLAALSGVISEKGGSSSLPLPPHLHSWVPLFGPTLSYSIAPGRFLRRVRQKLGNVFSFDLAGRRVVVLAAESAVRQYYRAPEEVLNAAESNQEFGFAKPSLKKVPKLNRHLLLVEVHRNMPEMMNRFDQAVCKFADDVMLGGSDSNTIRLFEASKRLYRRCLLATFVGEELLQTQFMAQHEAYEKVKMKSIIKNLFVPKSILRLMGDGNNSLAQARSSMVKTLESMLPEPAQLQEESAKSEIDSEEAGTKQVSYIRFIQKYHAEHEIPLTRELMAEYLLDLVFGASANPSLLAGQVLLMLLEHPQALARVQAELSWLTEDARDILPRLKELPYLDMCVRETLRMCTHPLGSMRKVKEDWTLQLDDGRQYVVPAGWFVGVAHNLLATDGDVFEKPDEFIPERFENAETKQEHPLSFIPFSGGRHACPGRSVAVHTAKIVLARWLQRYTFSLPAGAAFPPIDFKGGATLAQRKGACPLVCARKVKA